MLRANLPSSCRRTGRRIQDGDGATDWTLPTLKIGAMELFSAVERCERFAGRSFIARDAEKLPESDSEHVPTARIRQSTAYDLRAAVVSHGSFP